MKALCLLITLSAVVFGATGCGDSGSSLADVTYYQDVKPILDAKCAQCHYPGGIAPFSLASYEDAVAYGAASKRAIESGTMPPWPPNDECAEYVGNRRLSPEHKDMLIAWIDRGQPEGDPENPAAPLDSETTGLSRVDMTMSMTEPYQPQPDPDYYDDYRCFVLPWPEAETTYVSGFRAVPGNAAIVHHVIAFLATPEQAAQYSDLDASEPGPGYTCFGGTGGPAQEWLGGWAPGGQGGELPPGMGMPVQPGSVVVLQVHYNTLYAATQGTVAPDQTTIELKFADQVDRLARIMPWANPLWLLSDTMQIPAGEADVTHSFAFDATFAPGVTSDTFEIYAASLHMHLLGKSGRLSIDRADGTSECLLQIDDWDFHWQEAYSLRAPVTFTRGDQLRLECNWDNSAANQPVINGQPQPPHDVSWGEGSTDEMCLGVLVVAEP